MSECFPSASLDTVRLVYVCGPVLQGGAWQTFVVQQNLVAWY